MEREDTAREEPFTRDPDLSHTAQNSGTTSLRASSSLYIEPDDLLAIKPTKAQASSSTPGFESPKEDQSEERPTKRPRLAPPLVHHTSRPLAPVTMSRHSSAVTSKGVQQYQLMSSETPADQARSLSQNNKDQLIDSLNKHKVNTITELRRVEKIFAYLDSEEVTEPMTSAWAYYVNSNNLLNELRGLTKRIPFSSDCLDEAKAAVVADPTSVRSWNYCWLVLVKVEKENLIMKYARALASKRTTWGDRQPTADDARKFITACVAEWTQAVRQLLKHWDTAPSTTGT